VTGNMCVMTIQPRADLHGPHLYFCGVAGVCHVVCVYHCHFVRLTVPRGTQGKDKAYKELVVVLSSLKLVLSGLVEWLNW
jgi:hypothetical protein